MSESFLIQLGNPLPLSLQLPAGGSGLFPRADIYDLADTAVAGSPFNLTEIGATARYTGASFTPLVAGTFTARFVVYSDAGHTIEARRYARDQDSYVVVAVIATAAALATVQADTDDIQTRLPATLSGGRMRSQVEGMDAGTVTAAAIATDAIDADALSASAVAEIQLGLATLLNQVTIIGGLVAINADTDDIQTRLPATLVGGRMRSHVEAMDAGVITAAVIATNAIDADALAADAVAEIADGVWDEVLAGHLTAGTTGKALDDAQDAASAAAIAAAVWDEPLPGAHPAGSAGAQVNLTRQYHTNRLEEASGNPGTLKLYDDAAATVIKTHNLTDETGGAIAPTVLTPARRAAGV